MIMFKMAECRILVVWTFVVLYIADISSAAGLKAACSASSDCASVSNAECVTATCQCSNGYKANGAACDLVYDTACTGTVICEGLANSACLQSKCACALGYVKSGNICSPIYGKTCSNIGDCAGLDHSACTSSKCACADGYEENNNICSPAVSSTTCTSDGDECDAIGNAQCDTNLLKCKCDQGYKENKYACDDIGLTAACSARSDCASVSNTECVTATCQCSNGYKANGAACDLGTVICEGLANSACLQSKCACAPGYVKSAVSSTTCTSGGNECDAIGNAQCDTSLLKCKCDQGYKENKDACEAIESGAVPMKSAASLVFGSMILLLIQAL